MNQYLSLLKTRCYQHSLASVLLVAAMSVHAAPTITNTNDSINQNTVTTAPSLTGQAASQANNANSNLDISNTLAAQLQPSNKALSDANQELLSRNAQLQRQVNNLQTQVNVLVYESKGQLFLYGAFTVLISLLVGIFISWLVFIRRERW